MEPLIFDRLSIGWHELRPRQAQAWPIGRARKETVRCFAGPGEASHGSPEGVEETPTGLAFPDWGHWRLIGGFGAIKVLLINPATPKDEIARQVLSFASANIWHCMCDHHLAHNDAARRYMEFNQLAAKFFHSDQPLGLHCGYAARFLAVLLDHLGFEVRLGFILDASIGHIFPEVWLPDAARWAVVDPDFGIMLRHTGKWLSFADMRALANEQRADEIEVVDISHKTFPTPDTQVPEAFFGQLTWRPEMMDPRNLCQPYYRRRVMVAGLPEIHYSPARILKRTERVLEIEPTPK